MDTTTRRFGVAALQHLLGGDDLDMPWRWHRAGEATGIYFEPLAADISQAELLAITGGLVGDNAASRRAVLTLPCSLAELQAFDDAAGLFRDRLQAGAETDQLLDRIGAVDREAGELARAIASGNAGPETAKERRARLLAWFDEEVQTHGEYGAVERVTARERARRPTAHRPNVGNDIRHARKARDEASRRCVSAMGQVVSAFGSPTKPGRKR